MKNLLYSNRFWVILALKTAVVLCAFILSFSIRFDFNIPQEYWSRIVSLIPALLIIKLLVFWKVGLFKGWWRYVSMPDLVQIFKGNLIASLLFISYAVFVHRLDQIPRSILALDGILCFMIMGGVRFATRAFRENYLPVRGRNGIETARVLVVGAGEGGQMIAREIRANLRLDMQIIGFVDDDPLKQRGQFQGLKVLGRQSDLVNVVHSNAIDEVIIAIPSATGKQIRSIVEKCREADVAFKILPGVGEMIDGRVSLQQVRDVNLEDLLGREAIRLDEKQISAYLAGKRVLVTGAAGSIGSEICRQISRFQPESLILFDNAETPVFHVEKELRLSSPDLNLLPIVGDVKNVERVAAVFDAHHPQVVFHAAAYKHVPLMESNPSEAVNNNIGGTMVVADASVANKVDTFVLVSTDKAVRPTSIMGTTKRVAELYVQSLAENSTTRFVTTRFGNVLGSNGSVIPTFVEQIKNGGPVTVTHPEVTRFFMTIPEATQLVLQAGSMGKGGEIFLFDMGEPVRISELAEELIRLSGYEPYEDIEIEFTGLRPGEKLYEELLLDEEGALPTHHKKICVAAASRCDANQLKESLGRLLVAASKIDQDGVKKALCQIVPEYCSLTHDSENIGQVIPFRSAH